MDKEKVYNNEININKWYSKKRLYNNRRMILSIILILIFIINLFGIKWGSDMLGKGGLNTIKSMSLSLLKPDLSLEIIILAIKSCLETFAYALISISIAIFLAIPISIFASGLIFENKFVILIARGIIGFSRAVHELIWAWLFVAAVGLNPIGAIFALAIPYSGYLAKIFADIMVQTPKEPIEALKLSGASKLQMLIYGYFPINFPNMFSYVMYRLECATRSSSVLSFVGLGGIGFQIQISLQDLKYNQVWTFMFFLIILILAIDKWGFEIRNRVKNKKFIRNSFYIFFMLIISSWIFVLTTNSSSIENIFQQKNLEYLMKFINRLFGKGETNPAFMDKKIWKEVFVLSIDTFKMSILATGIAAIGMLFFVLFSARNIVDGSLTSYKYKFSKIFYYISKVIFLISRAIPELMWAMIFVFIFKPGILPGALALALHNFGVLGKLCAEVIENINEKPIKNIVLNGADQKQIMFYGIFPEVLPKFVNYILYRLENVIRATLIVGFVGASELGLNFKLAMSHFKYSEILVYLICYLILVYVTDFISFIAKKIIS